MAEHPDISTRATVPETFRSAHAQARASRAPPCRRASQESNGWPLERRLPPRSRRASSDVKARRSPLRHLLAEFEDEGGGVPDELPDGLAQIFERRLVVVQGVGVRAPVHLALGE